MDAFVKGFNKILTSLLMINSIASCSNEPELVLTRVYYQDSAVIMKEIDITKYIKSGNYRPDSCNGKIYAMISNKPTQLNHDSEVILQRKFAEWLDKYNSCISRYGKPKILLKPIYLYRNTFYEYTILNEKEELIHLYRTETHVPIGKTDNINLAISIDNQGNVIDNYRIDGSVLISCEDAMEDIQVIHDEPELNGCLIVN